MKYYICCIFSCLFITIVLCSTPESENDLNNMGWSSSMKDRMSSTLSLRDISPTSSNLLASLPYDLDHHEFGFQAQEHNQQKSKYAPFSNQYFSDVALMSSLLQSMTQMNTNAVANEAVEPQYTIKQIQYTPKGYQSIPVRARVIQVKNPINRVSFVPPPNGCGTVDTVQKTAKQYGCIVATNAGFFNTKNFDCLGPVISDGKIINRPTAINAAFGITKSGNFSVGYMNQNVMDMIQFDQLISGVIWLVKDGKPYVNEALEIEDMDTQTSGTGRHFVNLRASRTAMGHTKDGELILLQADGDGNVPTGLNLHEMADILIKFGVVQAINLDGGGSSTTIVNGEIVSSVSDGCPNEPLNFIRCPRAVSTIVCIHPLVSEKNLPTMFWVRILVVTTLIVVFASTSFSIIFYYLYKNSKRKERLPRGLLAQDKEDIFV